MVGSSRIAFYSESNFSDLKFKLDELKIQYKKFSENDFPELIILDEGSLGPAFLKKISLVQNTPSIAVFSKKTKAPELIFKKQKDHFFDFIQTDSAPEVILFRLSALIEHARRHRRLLALRSHHEKGWNYEENPALQLLSLLIKKCALAKNSLDILDALSAFKKDIEYHDSMIIFLDENKKALHSVTKYDDKKEVQLDWGLDLELVAQDMELGIPLHAQPSSALGAQLNTITKTPWSSALLLLIKLSNIQSKFTPKYALLCLLKRTLYPFDEKDSWLLEMSYGPVSLGIEKILVLSAIELASKEWRSTFDSISEPITVVDEEFNIIKANRAFAAAVEIDVKKIKNRKCYSLLARRKTPCANCPILNKNPRGTRITEKYKQDLHAWSYEVSLKKEKYHFQFYRNVTKETALTSALIQSEKMAALGKLVSAIAHEINNPLAGILATSQLLKSELELKDFHDDIEEIEGAASRSKKIIENLLGFTENSCLEKEPLKFKESLHFSLAFAKSALKRIQVESIVAPSLAKKTGSNSLLQQVLFNLITNAAQAMNYEGSLKVNISNVDQAAVSISISDSGPGIAKDKLKYLFDPFYTTKEEGKGTGLGLSIVKNIVQKLGGSISVKSELGRGSTFEIIL